jgi:hypothetical protein
MAFDKETKTFEAEVNDRTRFIEVFFQDGVPALLEITEKNTTNVSGHFAQVGLDFEDKALIDYDGVHEFPYEAIEPLESLGYDMTYVRDEICDQCGTEITEENRERFSGCCSSLCEHRFWGGRSAAA